MSLITQRNPPEDTLYPCDLSVIAPAHNEAENLKPFVSELDHSLSALNLDYEIVIIDDGSIDDSRQILADLAAKYPNLRSFSLGEPGGQQSSGQSAAYYVGIKNAQGRNIALIDSDLQNSPDDIGPMLDRLNDEDIDMVQGDRSSDRHDTTIRKFTSKIGKLFRRYLLKDTIVDTGCSLRVFSREVGLNLPLQYAGMHRFIPIYARMLGFSVVEVPVRHRPRVAGSSKYGVWDRARVGLIDLFAVRWMRKRLRNYRIAPINVDQNSRPQ